MGFALNRKPRRSSVQKLERVYGDAVLQVGKCHEAHIIVKSEITQAATFIPESKPKPSNIVPVWCCLSVVIHVKKHKPKTQQP